jgi:hypothetical protein
MPGVATPPQTVARAVSRADRGCSVFAVLILAVSLLLQRFAIPFGENGVDLVGPLGLLIALSALAHGSLTIHRQRLGIFALLLAWFMVSSAVQAMFPGAYGDLVSVKSLGQLVLLTSFCIFSFSQPVNEIAFFRGATSVLATIAAAGIIQFCLQFAGISLFSFTGIVPNALLFESGWNVVIPVGIGTLNKSNGFFLLEPSIFSQAMAMGLIIEILTSRRLLFLFLFTTAVLLAFSGTGLLVLAAFALGGAAKLGKRGVVIAFASTTIVIIAGGLLVYLLPDVAHVFSGRLNEFNTPGTSGYARFRSPFLVLESAWSRDNLAWLTGMGAGAGARLSIAIYYNTNIPIKITLEYGLPGLLIYTVMILCAERTRIQEALLFPSLALLFFAGDYTEFAPMLFPIFMLLCVARLRSAPRYEFGS